MSDKNDKPENKPQTNDGGGEQIKTSLENAKRNLLIYEEQRRLEVETINDLQRRVRRMEALMVAHGIDLDEL